MTIQIIDTTVSHSKEDGYIGHVMFQYEGHTAKYEITLQSKNKKEWNYSLNFAHESGKEEDILFVDEQLEEDDELFENLVDAVVSKL